MPLTYDYELPTDEELTVDELNVSMATLFAGALHLGKICSKENNEFMLCRGETKDPRMCLEEGKEVTRCALEFFQKLKEECFEEFNQYALCLHRKAPGYGEFNKCRETQGVYDKCVLDKLGVERPHFAWNSQIQVHETQREKPVKELPSFPGAAERFIPPENLSRK